MNSERIRFDKYGIDELVAILQARAERGLTPDAIDRAQLERIADVAAGDARIAIGVLRNAARQADRDGLEEITDDAIEAAIPETQTEINRKNVETLTPHQRTLYEIIVDQKEIAPGELYDAYCEQVDDPKTKRTMRKHLSKMAHYNLVVAEGENRGRIYRLA